MAISTIHDGLDHSRPGLIGYAAHGLHRLSLAMIHFEMWLGRHHTRRALMALDDHELADIGLSRADAWAEGTKPFWR